MSTNEPLLLEAIVGEVKTPSSGYMSSHVLYCPKIVTHFDKEVPLFSVNNELAKKHSVGHFMPSLRNYRSEVSGIYSQTVYALQPDVILRIDVRRMDRGDSFPVKGSCFIRMRRGAALRRITIPTFNLPIVERDRFSVVGNFDLISHTEASTITGRIPAQYLIKSFSEESVSKVMAFEMLEPEKTETTVVSNGIGSQTSMSRVIRRRVVTLRPTISKEPNNN